MNNSFSETTSFSMPRVGVIDLPVKSKNHFLISFWSFFNSLTNSVSPSGPKSFSLRGIKIKKILPIFIIAILILIFAILSGRKKSDQTINTPATASQVKIAAARSFQTINREFEFPLKDTKGNELSKLKYTIESAELRDQIIVQGKTATAIEGKTFLILTLKIQNTFDKAIDINARDYIRLTVNGNQAEQIAAEIHNDPVNVQAISTKATRIGFPVNITDKDMNLLVGEIKGEKETVPLTLN